MITNSTSMKLAIVKNKVEIFDDIVIKQSLSPHLFIEVEKTRRAYDIATRTGLFTVPKVLDFEMKSGRVVYERLQFVPVSRIPWSKRVAVVCALGQALAAIHNHLQLPDPIKKPLPSSISFPHETTFIHGDLSVDNVGIEIATSKPVIIDWQTTRHYGGNATYDSRFFDLSWFTINLIVRPYTRFLYSNPVTPIVEEFIRNYFQASPAINVSLLTEYARIFFPLELQRSHKEILQNSKGRAIILFPWCKKIYHDVMRLFISFAKNQPQP